VIPIIMYNQMNIPFNVAQFFRRDQHVDQRRCDARHDAADGIAPVDAHYDGFLKKGRIKGRF
jgi:hypothetical protein